MRHERNNLRAQELKEKSRTEQEMQETRLNQPETRENVGLENDQELDINRHQQQSERGNDRENLTERSDRRL